MAQFVETCSAALDDNLLFLLICLIGIRYQLSKPFVAVPFCFLLPRRLTTVYGRVAINQQSHHVVGSVAFLS